MKKKIYVLSSTHWDREWYQTFEEYRTRLVRLIDNLLDIMENDEEYKFFHFDGQTILIEDYLAIRPENKARLEKLITNGRILIGPWYTMPDEFLVSGEALIRNLLKGKEICDGLGVKANNSGYICDIFGHNDQMPQIFKNFGVDNASLFRGRKGAEKDNFLWVGADGTETICHKLHPHYAYSSFFFVVRWPNGQNGLKDEEIVKRVKAYLNAEEKNFSCAAHLMIDGVDHIDPEKDIPRILNVLNANIEEYEFIHSNFEDYNKAVSERRDSLERVEGCLYDVAEEGINNNLIKNVLSSQIHLKQANDKMESELTLKLEPLEFFFNLNRDKLKNHVSFFPYKSFIDKAWGYVLENQPHDSICGCSITATHEDNVNRFKRAGEITEAVKKDIFKAISKNTAANHDVSFNVFNFSQLDINEVKIINLELKEGTHQWNFKIYDEKNNEIEYSILSHKTIVKKNADFKKLVKEERFDSFEIAMPVNIPALSYKTFGCELINTNWERKTEWGINVLPQTRYLGSMRTGMAEFDTGAVKVRFVGGKLSVKINDTGKTYEGMLSLEDCADIGDGWNFRNPKFNEEYLSDGSNAAISIMRDTKYAARVKIGVDLKVPASATSIERSEITEIFHVEHIVTILKNSKKIEIETFYTNNIDNHRLRVCFPTNIKADKFQTLLPFNVSEFLVKKEDWSKAIEEDTLVNPNQGLVSISDNVDMFSVYNKGIYEVSVLDRDDTPVYLTLLRSFTNEVMELKGNMGRMLGKDMRLSYLLDFEMKNNSELVKNANQFKLGLETVMADAEIQGEELENKEIIKIDGGGVLSSCRMINNDILELRLYDVDGDSRGKVKLPVKIKSIAAGSADGTVTTEISFSKDNEFKYSLKKKEVKTYFIKLH